MNREHPTPPPVDWLPAAAAARLIPSPRAGKRTCTQTVVRLIQAGLIDGHRRGRWWFASRPSVLAFVAGEFPR